MKKMMILLNTFTLLLLVLTPSYAYWRGYGNWGMMGPGMMGCGSIFMIIFWALVIICLIFLIKWLASLSRSRGRHERGRDLALDILKQRYAKGEINKEEFDQKKKDLM